MKTTRELPVDVVALRAHLHPRPHRRAAIPVELRVAPLEVLRQQGQLLARLRERRPPLQPPLQAQLPIVAVREEVLLRTGFEERRHGEGDVEVGAVEDQHPREGLGSHADHGEVGSVQPDRLSDDGRIAAHLAFPEVGAEHRHGVAARGLVLFLAKAPAERRLHAEHSKVVAGDQHAALDPRRLAGNRAESHGADGQIGDDAVIALRVLADVEVLAVGEIVETVVARGAHQRHDLARTRHGIGTEDQGVEHAVGSRRHPDAQRDRDHDDRGQAGRPPQASERVADVVHEVRQPVDAARVPDLLFPLVEPAHRAERPVSSLLGREAFGDALLDLVLQVEPELLVELALDPAAAEDGFQPQRELVPPVLHPHGELPRPPPARRRARWPPTAASSSPSRFRAAFGPAG